MNHYNGHYKYSTDYNVFLFGTNITICYIMNYKLTLLLTVSIYLLFIVVYL